MDKFEQFDVHIPFWDRGIWETEKFPPLPGQLFNLEAAYADGGRDEEKQSLKNDGTHRMDDIADRHRECHCR